MKKSVIACLLLTVTVLSAGCGSQKKADPIESTHDETDIEDETVEISSDDGTSMKRLPAVMSITVIP